MKPQDHIFLAHKAASDKEGRLTLDILAYLSIDAFGVIKEYDYLVFGKEVSECCDPGLEDDFVDAVKRRFGREAMFVSDYSTRINKRFDI